MSSHDCRLSGTLTIAAGITREQLFAAVAPYLEHHSRSRLSHNLVDPHAKPGAEDEAHKSADNLHENTLT